LNHSIIITNGQSEINDQKKEVEGWRTMTGDAG